MLSAILCAMLLSACGSKEEIVQEEPVVRPVKLLTLKKASSLETRRFPVVIEAATSRTLSFNSGGLVEEISVKESQRVEVGDVVARLVTRDFQNQLDSAKAQFDNAEEEYQRAVRLFDQNAIAKSGLEQRKSQRDVAQAQFDSAEKALNDATLVSPISGVVTSVAGSTLQNIGPGEPVATIVSIDGLQATVNLPATLMSRIDSRTNRKASVILDAAPASPVEATFKEASLEADPTTQTFGLTFTFDSPKGFIVLPGMSATMVLTSMGQESDDGNSSVSVPLGAVVSQGDLRFVWVVDDSTMIVSRREVQISDSIGESVTVVSGLSVGETIAAAGSSYLSEGMEVRAWEGN